MQNKKWIILIIFGITLLSFMFIFSNHVSAFTEHTITIRPQSDSTPMQWTPNSGTNHTNRVNQITYDGDSTYEYTSSISRIDSFNMQNFLSGTGYIPNIGMPYIIDDIQIYVCAKKTSGGTAKIFAYPNWLYATSNLYMIVTTSYINYSFSYTEVGSLLTQRPITKTDIDNLIVYIQDQNSLNQIRVTRIYVNVDYHYNLIVNLYNPNPANGLTSYNTNLISPNINGLTLSIDLGYNYFINDSLVLYFDVYDYNNFSHFWYSDSIEEIYNNGTYEMNFPDLNLSNITYIWYLSVYSEFDYSQIYFGVYNSDGSIFKTGNYSINNTTNLTNWIDLNSMLTIDNNQFILSILLVIWLLFCFKYYEYKISNEGKIFAFGQLGIMFPLELILGNLCYSNNIIFGYVILFIIPIVSSYIVIDMLFYDKKIKSKKK